ncbi:hypothetical protein FRC15_001011 [Serendipita sp. 397]|nr:hypothetical protein FRC15_001011 [Serendipita sp. 397]
MSSWDFLRQPVSIDSSNSEDENGQIKDPPRSYPHMKLFSEEKRKRMEEERALLWEARRAGIDENDYASCKTWRMWAHKRFFNTIIGFHLGSLDLTGRHKEAKIRKAKGTLEPSHTNRISDRHAVVRVVEPSVAEGHNRIWDLFKDDLMWSVFTERWKLHEEIDPKEFVLEFSKTLLYIQETSGPIFQRLTLQQLPIKLLQGIYGHTNGDTTRALASTCKYLQRVGEPFIFQCVILALTLPYGWHKNMQAQGLKGRAARKDYLQNLASSSRAQYTYNASRIISQPQMATSIRSLILLNLWGFDNRSQGPKDNLPYDGHEPWYLIAFFTNLRDLVMEPDPDAFCSLPDRFFTSTFPVFSTLERFSTMEGEITPLITWILDPSSATDLGSRTTISTTVSNLTHFRFHTLDPMRRDTIQIIVSALHHAPNLRLLALEMIYLCDATPDLVQVISSALPRITGLTLKTSARKCPRWICPIWEYGKPFASFKNLEYLGWDYRCEVTYTPIDFSFVENGYPDGEDWVDGVSRFNEGTLIGASPDAAVFLAYCPSLKTVAFLRGDRSWSRTCVAKQTDAGFRMEDRYDIESEPRWDPWKDAWPDVTPR